MNHTNVVDVKAWIDTRPVSRFQWNVLLLCFIIIMLDGYDAAVMGFVAPALIEDWGISRAEMGPILGAAMFGVAIGALVAGPLSDRYGRKRILLYGASIKSFALPLTPSINLPAPGRRHTVYVHFRVCTVLCF